MTPQERQLVTELFDRVARLEQSPRESDAETAIAEGLRRAPHAPYALVQTVLVQDEALKRAHARIQELEGGTEANSQAGGFLGSMRDAILGPSQSRGSVPNVSPNGQRPVWNSGQVVGQNDPRQDNQGRGGGGIFGGGGGGSFLGTAAATAAGVIGGSMLMNSFRGMMGGGHQQSLADTSSGASSNPWSGGSSGTGDLARDAGVNDIGKNTGNNTAGDQKQSFADHASNDTSDEDNDDDDFGSDFDSGGDSDYA